MIKLIALYRRPDDLDAFLEHYREVHTPLTRQLPGLERLVVDRVTADAFGGEPEFVLMAEMHFPDAATFKTAMRSDENRRLGADLQSFAKGIATVLITESEEVG